MPSLPKTRSGKIMRRLLKARELGLPEGDLSTLEGSEQHDVTRTRWTPPARDAAHPPLRGEGGRALHASARSAASSTSTSARRRWRSGAMQALTADDASSRPTASTARRSRAACRRARSWPRCTARPTAAAAAAAARCTSSTSSRRFYGGHAIVGGGLPVAVGLALADAMQRRAAVTACFFGDGAVAEGEFHESLNLAALWRLPVLFLCENNLYAMGTALARHQAQPDIARKAEADGVPAEAVDGMDVLAVEAATRRAADAVRGGGGPRLLEAAHVPLPRALDVRPGALPHQGRDRASGSSATRSRSSSRRCAARGVLVDAELAAHRSGGRRRGRRRGRGGRGGAVGAGRGPPEGRPHRAGGAMKKMTYREAARSALREALRSDPRVFLMGEDVGPLRRRLRREPRPARGVRARARARHAAQREHLRRRRASAPRSAGCGRSSR